jgi:molecular chaperone GrpE (heat shock protein)
MPDDETHDTDLDTQLRGLFHEAEQQLEDRAVASRRMEEGREQHAKVNEERALRAYISVPQMLRPVVLGLEAVTRAAGENSVLLAKLGEKFDKNFDDAIESEKAMPGVLDSLRTMLEQKNTVTMRMFAALHEELKGYKDGFLLESVHKPIIRDLISLYDDLSKIHAQMQELAANSAAELPESALPGRLKRMDENIEHNCEFVIEVLARLEVMPLPRTTGGKLDKHNQRAVSVENAASEAEDGEIVRSVKRGFLWKGRMLRPEEVVVRKWKPAAKADGAPALSQ